MSHFWQERNFFAAFILKYDEKSKSSFKSSEVTTSPTPITVLIFTERKRRELVVRDDTVTAFLSLSSFEMMTPNGHHEGYVRKLYSYFKTI